MTKWNRWYGIALLGKTIVDVQYFLKTIKSHMVISILHICHTEAVILAFYVLWMRSLLPLFEFHIYLFIILNLVYNPPGASRQSHFGFFLIVQGPCFWLAGEKELKLHFICEPKYIFNIVFLFNGAPERYLQCIIICWQNIYNHQGKKIVTSRRRL